MQVTQIFFDWIEEDGKAWDAVIDHSGVGARFTAFGARPLRIGNHPPCAMPHLLLRVVPRIHPMAWRHLPER